MENCLGRRKILIIEATFAKNIFQKVRDELVVRFPAELGKFLQ